MTRIGPERRHGQPSRADADPSSTPRRKSWPSRSGRCPAAIPGTVVRSGRRLLPSSSPAPTRPVVRSTCPTPPARLAVDTGRAATVVRLSRPEIDTVHASRDQNIGRPDVEDWPFLALLEELGIRCDPQLLDLALTHRSYAFENGGIPTNERLEFLGDAILEVGVTDYLYRAFPDKPEGQLAKDQIGQGRGTYWRPRQDVDPGRHYRGTAGRGRAVSWASGRTASSPPPFRSSR